MTSRPLHLLLVTPLDIDKMPGNSEHRHIAHYAALGWRVTVVDKVLNRSLRPRDLLRDSLTATARVRDDGPVRHIAVDPFLNYFAGLRRHAETAAPAAVRGARRPLRLVRLLAPLAALRDLFFVPCAALAACRHVGRPVDLCLGFGPWGALTGLLLRLLGPVPRVIYQDRDYEPGLLDDPFRRAYTAAAERFALRRADAVVSIGRRLARLRRLQSRRPVHLISIGVDPLRFAPAPEAPRPPRLIYVGQLVDWAGLEAMIDAFPRVRALPHAAFLIVGDGLPAYVDTLRARIRALGLDSAVTLHGRCDPADLPRLLAASSAGFAASAPNLFRRYARPLKVLEYMAAGLAVIATERTEAGWLVNRASCGVAVSHHSDALAGAVIATLRDPAAARVAGPAFVRDLAWPALLDRQAALLAAVAGSTAPAPAATLEVAQ